MIILMKQNGFAPILIILGIVLLLGIAGGAYYFGQSSVKVPALSQVPVPTSQTSTSPTQPIIKTISSPITTAVNKIAGWQIYQNEKLRFTIEYPYDYRPEILEPTNDQTHEKMVNLMLWGEDSIEIYVQNDFGLSLIDWLTKYAKYTKQDIKNGKSITLDNQTGYRFVGNNMGTPYPIVYLKKDNIIYSIQSVVGENKIFDQVLSTIKFVN